MQKVKTTSSATYTQKLLSHENCWWKQMLNVQAPYRWNIRRIDPGFTFEIGCGIGRLLSHLDGYGVGIDHNKSSVQIACERGLKAYVPEDFDASAYNKVNTFDSVLLSHVAEHLGLQESVKVITQYIPLLKENGKLIIITPQEAGYRSDLTHVEFIDFAKLSAIFSACGFQSVKQYSFPFPRHVGRFFKYNEFIAIGSKITP